MPTVQKGDKILVTGANGYLALWIVQWLLERGYRVRGTVRSDDKSRYAKEYFSKLGYGPDRLEYLNVADIEAEGAFDEAVKGVDGIIHTASPFHGNSVEDVQEFFGPAIQGTVGILDSARRLAPQVKRIVFTSSVASMVHPPEKPTRYSEKDWNTGSLKEVEEKGAKTRGIIIYRASKTLSERAALEFVEKHKNEIKFDISIINPCWIFGPPIHELKDLHSLNTTLQFFHDAVLSDKPNTKEFLGTSDSWVDVRDASLAHVLALEKEAAGGERIIVAAGGFTWQEFIEAVASLGPDPFPGHKLPKGYPELLGTPQEQRVYQVTYDTSKQDRILGIKWKTQAEMAKATLEEFIRRGW